LLSGDFPGRAGSDRPCAHSLVARTAPLPRAAGIAHPRNIRPAPLRATSRKPPHRADGGARMAAALSNPATRVKSP